MRRSRLIALLVWSGTMIATAVAILVIIATREVAVPTSWGFRGASAIFATLCGTVGAIVAMRRPDNINGWLFCTIGVFFAAQTLALEYVIAGTFVADGGLPGMTAVGWTLTWLWIPPLGIALIFLPLFFPTGHLLTPRWRAVAILGAIAVVGFGVALAFVPGPIEQATFLMNPLGLPGVDLATYSNIVIGPIWLPLTAAIVLSLTSLVVRFRRSSNEARQQIKWFALAVSLAGATFALYIAVTVGAPSSTRKVLELLVIVTLGLVPAAAGMAILRYRLYDIDRIISRTIAYAVVTGVLAIVFAGAILLMQSALASFTQGQTVAVAASTLAVFALFQPLRRRVQRVVDRRFDRARYDGERTVVAFSERLRNETDMGTVTVDLVRTANATVAPSSLSIWLRPRRVTG